MTYARTNIISIYAYHEGRSHIIPADIMSARQNSGATPEQIIAEFVAILAGYCSAYHIKPEDIQLCALTALHGWTNFGGIDERWQKIMETYALLSAAERDALVKQVQCFKAEAA